MKTQRIILTAMVSLVAVIVLFGWWQYSRFGGRAGYGAWHMGPGHMMGGFGFGVGGLLGLIFWALVLMVLIMAIAWIAQLVSRAESGGGKGPDAAEILKQRYARGEIEREEFEDRLKDILSLEPKGK